MVATTTAASRTLIHQRASLLLFVLLLLQQRCVLRVGGTVSWNRPTIPFSVIAFMHDSSTAGPSIDGGGSGSKFPSSSREGSHNNIMDYSSNNSNAVNQDDNDNDDGIDTVMLPYREYGYRSEPFTWDELIQIIEKEKNLAKLSRSIQQERDYQHAMKSIKRQWKSVYDHILHTKFGFEKREVETRTIQNNNGDGLHEDTVVLWESYPPLSEIQEIQKVLVLNDFPYYNGPGIFHYVLWKIGGEDVSDQDIEEAREELCSKLGDVQDILHWKNPPHLKSLPDIDHIHILCQRREKPNN